MKLQTAILFFMGVAICRADTMYTVAMDTAGLIDNSNGPFALDFQLTSGNTTSGVVNSASISQFTFATGGGAATGSPFANSGNVSGSLASTVSLNTSSGVFFNEFSQYFIPGKTLSFTFTVSNNPQGGSAPDEFTFQLIDSSGSAISSTDPSGSNSLLILDLTGGALQPQIYAITGDGVTIAPSLGATTPEPGTALLTLGALIAFLIGVANIRLLELRTKKG